MGEESPSLDELVREIEQLRVEAREHEDQLLRARADLENQRKRGARQSEEARKFAIQIFVRELLPVKDSLERGLEAASDGAGDRTEALKSGIRLTLRLWSDALASSGVEELDPVGQLFDPEFHEALSIQSIPGVPHNTVLEVAQKGYLLNGRLIRPARVVVAGDPQGGEEEDS